jgi:hypothetical protein
MNRAHRCLNPMRVLFLSILLAAIPLSARAQEFNCSVSVNYRNLTGSDYTYLDELKQRVTEYVNLQRWTEDRYEEHERIECTLQIVFLEAVSLTRFKTRLIVATRRPIYGTTQQTTVLQLSDEDWTFDYAQGTPLVYDPERYHPITSVLNFYALIMLGFDYDTFSPEGGSPFFDRARRISDIAQSSGASGWSTLGADRSRTDLITQIMDPRFKPLRASYYDYHFGCLDRFVADTETARDVMLELVKGLQTLAMNQSRSYYLDQFFATKYQEIAAVFQSSRLASQAFDVLAQVDPAHMSEYNRMME